MSLLYSWELAAIQNDAVSETCDKTCQIYRKTRTPDGLGGYTENYSLIETTVAGLGEPSAGELQNYDFEIGDKEAVKVRLPIKTDAQGQDRLVIENQTFEIHILLNPKSFEVFHSVIATEIK